MKMTNYIDDEDYIDIHYDIYSVGMDIDMDENIVLINDSPISSPISRTRHLPITDIQRVNSLNIIRNLLDWTDGCF